MTSCRWCGTEPLNPDDLHEIKRENWYIGRECSPCAKKLDSMAYSCRYDLLRAHDRAQLVAAKLARA